MRRRRSSTSPMRSFSSTVRAALGSTTAGSNVAQPGGTLVPHRCWAAHMSQVACKLEVSRNRDGTPNSTATMEEPTVKATHDWVERGTIRAELEMAELRTLAPWAAKSAHSAGRAQPESEDPVRTCWMRDLDRITFSRTMLRAHGKTQSFIPAFSNEGPAGGSHGGPFIGDHYVTRATHVQQTARIAATIAQALSLNVPLATAIAVGHDLGHACFGHGGEAALQALAPGGFDHAAQGVRLLTLLEPRNLTAEVLDGIGHHSWKHRPPSTLEGMCVRLDEVPAEVRRALGETPSDMVGTLVEDTIRHSRGEPHVVQGDGCAAAMITLRGFMFERVYLRPEAERQSDRAKRLLTDLHGYYLEHPEAMPMGASLAGDPVQQQVVDAIAGMTDRYALAAWKAAFATEP